VSRVVVAGASAAGLATVEALRRKGFDGELILLGAEANPPYDRPPLSKQVLSGAWEPDRARLRTPDALSSLDVELVLGDPAAGLDAGTRVVRTASGREFAADAVVVATGVRPRRFTGQDALSGVHVLRTLEDALALRADLLAAGRLVVVGDGVLGAEIAATARSLGVDVTLAGPQATPLESQFGPFVGGLLTALHTAHGVRLRLGTAVTGLDSRDGRVTGVRLDGGEVLPADVVVVAIGSDPAIGWLAGSGLTFGNGVLCDSRCRAAPGIYAAGDIACWHHEGLGAPLRLENRTNATEQGIAVAGAILGEDRPYVPVPYFWTDQYDVKIQVHGVLHPAAEVSVVDGDPAAGRFVARYRRGGATVGVLGWNMPKQIRSRRPEVAETLTRVPALEEA
jgi:NADPH-dependent 2,4-dienoyl-CoA reductase/sulfur reductase-like enzyme